MQETIQENENQNLDSPEKESYLKIYAYLFGIASIIIFLDQWSKNWVRKNLAFGQVWDSLPDLQPYARILHWQNSGSAFGMFQNGNLIIMVLAVSVTLIIVIYFPQIPKEDWALRAALSFQMGGAVGNLIDRMQFGHVTDFLSVGNFPVWNVADMAISAGVVILLIGVIIAEKQEREEKRNAKLAQTEDSSEKPDTLAFEEQLPSD